MNLTLFCFADFDEDSPGGSGGTGTGDQFVAKIQELLKNLKNRGFSPVSNLETQCLLATILNDNHGNVDASANKISKCKCA